jgi:hypothetical protein
VLADAWAAALLAPAFYAVAFADAYSIAYPCTASRFGDSRTC